ncbi:MAG TPA: hypothetical protein VGH43_03820 [Jatrophihabitans sp.]
MVDPGVAPPTQQHRHPRQNLILACAGALLAAVVVIVLVLTLSGSDGPATGSPDAVTDQLAAALHAHDVAGVRDLSCRAQRAIVARDVTRGALAHVTSARRKATAEVQGDVAVDLIGLEYGSQPGSMTVALRHVGDAWCITSLSVASQG